MRVCVILFLFRFPNLKLVIVNKTFGIWRESFASFVVYNNNIISLLYIFMNDDAIECMKCEFAPYT